MKRKFMKKITLFGLLLAVIFSCTDPYENNITPAHEQYPIATFLENDSTFSQWVALLKYTDLFNTMNLSANYTCFVPNDGAMQKYLDQKGVSAVEDLPLDEATYLVKYHTIVGKQYPQSLFDNGVIPDTTATGDFLSIQIRAGGLNAIYVNDEARITQLDLQETNGIIHVLDNVLTPVTQTIKEKMDAPEFSIMKDAIQITGYSDVLNTISAEEVNPETGVTQYRKKHYTFFAVPDDVFMQKGINSAADLATYLQADNSNYTDPTNKLNKFVAYHILSQQLDFASLASFQGDHTSKNIATLAPNELINVSEENDQLYINFNQADSSHVSIVNENINTKNGMIHTVDGLMEIIVPPVTTVTWELTDYADVASAVSNIYRKSGVTSTTRHYFSVGDLTSYNWAAIPSSNNNGAVAYLVANKNDAVRYEMVNHDCLYLNLGLYGWIEMQTPAIIKGTYTMKVSYYSIAAPSQYGSFLTILDGDYVGSQVSTHGASSSKTQIVKTTIGEVSFDETTTHKLRLLAGDDAGIYIDYIEFEPVK